VVVAAVARIVDIPAVVLLARVRPREAAIAVATLATVVAAGTLEGIGVAIGLSLLDVLYRRLRGGGDPSGEPAVTASLDSPASLSLSGPLFYANAERWERQIAELADHSDADEIAVDAAAVTDIDATAADTLRDLSVQLHRQQRSLRLTGVTPPVEALLDRYGLDLVDRRTPSHPVPTRSRPGP
jgi:sulfate permease, SulP family